MISWEDMPVPHTRRPAPPEPRPPAAPAPAAPHACYFVTRLGALACTQPGCGRVVTAEGDR
jgi:hypothetical protein